MQAVLNFLLRWTGIEEIRGSSVAHFAQFQQQQNRMKSQN